MKRLGVAGIIRSGGKHSLHILLGRRGKDPNRGLYVLPGGGVENNESLEEAFCREIKEETGLDIVPNKYRWYHPYIIELSDRVILVDDATIQHKEGFDDTPRDGGDLYDVAWFSLWDLPSDISPAVLPVLASAGLVPKSKLVNITA